MEWDRCVPLWTFLKKCVSELSPPVNISQSVLMEISTGLRRLTTTIPQLRVEFVWPDHKERYLLRAKKHRGGLDGKRLIVEHLPAADIFAGLTDHQRGTIEGLLEDYRAENALAADRLPRGRRKKFGLKNWVIIKGGGRVNPEANLRALIIRSRALLTGRYGAPEVDGDFAS